MRILMVNALCGSRGTGRMVGELAKDTADEKHGCIVKIGYGREKVPDMYNRYAVPIGNEKTVNRHGSVNRMLDRSGFGSKKPTKDFIDWVKRFEPDVIHLHSLHGYYVHIGELMKYCRNAEKPIIMTVHDDWAFSGHSSYCALIDCEKWKTGCGRCPLKSSYPAALIDRSKSNFKRKKSLFSGLQNCKVVTPSHWMEKRVKESFLGAYDVSVIAPGIDTAVFHPGTSDLKETLGISGRTMVLGVASGFDELRGLDDYKKLSEMLGPDYSVVLVGVSAFKQKLLPEGMIGKTRPATEEELADYYRAADVFVNFSYYEPYSLVNAESVASGTPVISYDTGGAGESAGSHARMIETGDYRKAFELIKAGDYEASDISEVHTRKETSESYKKLYGMEISE